MENLVYMQKYNCIKAIGDSKGVFKISINSPGCARKFKQYAKKPIGNSMNYKLAFGKAKAVKVSLEDFVCWWFRYSDEAMAVAARCRGKVKELRKLQSECADDIVLMFEPCYVVIDEYYWRPYRFVDEAGADLFIADRGSDDCVKHRFSLKSIDFEESVIADDYIEVRVMADIDGDIESSTISVQHSLGYDCEMEALEVDVHLVMGAGVGVEEVAGAWFREAVKSAWVYHDAGFNCSARGMSLAVKEAYGGFWPVIIYEDCNFNSSGTGIEEVCACYDSLDEAMEDLDCHRTNEHFDFEGLLDAIASIKEANREVWLNRWL